MWRAAFLRTPAKLTSRTLREKRGLTLRDLAKQAKVTEAYVATIETGVRKNPSLAILKRLAKALAVPRRRCWNEEEKWPSPT